MIRYHVVNAFLEEQIDCRNINELMALENKLPGEEGCFIDSVLSFLATPTDRRLEWDLTAHCFGSCVINMSKVGIYALLDDGITAIHTPLLKQFGSIAEWQMVSYSFDDIQTLDMEKLDRDDLADKESGVLFMKVTNEKRQIRNYTLRNLNPAHLEQFQRLQMIRQASRMN
ncbi:hypothetical protein GCM10022378_19550 [Salinicoccus jeotgali]|uniref:YokE-like PH domain-containing protein n=1 Tax=Salinicoccus jeotgali TaxID=381634 RepID=A0ABP7FA61_9STAP